MLEQPEWWHLLGLKKNTGEEGGLDKRVNSLVLDLLVDSDISIRLSCKCIKTLGHNATAVRLDEITGE